MKHIQLIFIQALLILILAACNITSPPEPTDTPSTSEVATSSEPRTGATAPDFTLPDSRGNMVHLADELKDSQTVVLVFYYSHN